MSKKTLGLIIGLLILTVVLLFIALRSENPQSGINSTKTTTTPTPTPIVDTILQLSPNPAVIGPSGLGKVDVMINTGMNSVAGVQLEFAYDPQFITNFVVKASGLTQNWVELTPINRVDPKTGRATYAIGKSPAQSVIKGQGVIATITFITTGNRSAQSTKIQILPKSQVGDLYSRISAPSALKQAIDTTIILPTTSSSSSAR